MGQERDVRTNSNVITLASARQRLRGGLPVPITMQPAAATVPCTGRARITVFFVTGGRFEAMVNGSVGVLSAGDFIRVPEGAAYGFSDIAGGAGALLSHRFASDVSPGFLKELARALPAFATALPPRGTIAYARLKTIAGRWGVALGSDEAA